MSAVYDEDRIRELNVSAPYGVGIKAGQRHSGQFRKGDDPRRVGGVKIYDGMTLAQMARKLGPECLDLWTRAMRDEGLAWPIRLKASEYIMDRGFGKAVSVIETTPRSLVSLSADELEAIAAGESPRLPITFEGEAAEVLPSTVTYSSEYAEENE